ncbi:MAG: hypothetical protein ABJC19_02065 [Gemmatimonadota bacterium]
MGAAAAVIMMKEKELVAHLREAGATSSATAKRLDTMRVDFGGVAFRRLQRRAVVREASPGLWYLDEPSWEALRGIRRRMLLILLVVLLAGVAAAYFTGTVRGS